MWTGRGPVAPPATARWAMCGGATLGASPFTAVLRIFALCRHDAATPEQQAAWRAAWAADKDARANYV